MSFPKFIKKLIFFIGSILLGIPFFIIFFLIYAGLGIFFEKIQALDQAYFLAYELPSHGLFFYFLVILSWFLGHLLLLHLSDKIKKVY